MKQDNVLSLLQSEERFRLLVASVRDYAIFMLDTEGHVLSWNAGAERFKGYKAAEIIGCHFSRFYPAEALARGLPQHELDVAREVGSFEDEGCRVRKDGSLFWANVVITAMRDESGKLVAYSKVTRDLTQRRHHEEALRQSEERFRLLVEGVTGYAIFMLNVNGQVETWNEGAQRIKGYAADDIVGKHFSIFYPQEAKDSGWPEHELQVASERGSFVDIGWRLRKDGRRFWANVTITALRDENQRLLGFAKLTRDLTESKRMEAIEMASEEREQILGAERDARMSAQRAARVKDEFLATLSHELRTPLNAILGWTQLALKKPASDKLDLARAFEVIDRNARAQAQLIDDLLDLSRITTGKIRLDLQPVSVRDIVLAALESAGPMAEAKEIALSSVLDSGNTTINADSGRLQQVVWNLLTNAIKFTPKGGEIRVRLQRVGDFFIELRVTDTGIGMPASFLPYVFDRFSQRDSSSTRAYGGLGLGLAISRQLVELHGGSIRVTSPGEGQGSSFFVELPISSAQIEDGLAHDSHGAEHRPAEMANLPKLDGVHVFVVDDEADGRDLLKRLLEDQGATVASFGSAEEALAALKTSRAAVIVSDVGMPGMDGYQMIRSLRASEPREARIPALALTAFARAEDRKRALLAGFQAHLAKPFDVTELMLLIANLAGR